MTGDSAKAAAFRLGQPLVDSFLYSTPLPAALAPDAKGNKVPVVVGVDEAGRGPVLGPMVYAVAYCPKDRTAELAAVGFADSKTLDEDARDALYAQITGEHAGWLGYAATTLSPHDISTSMLRRNKYNLNALAHDTTIGLLRSLVESGVAVSEVYVDTVGPPDSYQRKLAALFPGVKVVVAKKADSLYPIVSAASICAKVTRDAILSNWTWQERNMQRASTEFGSGYPADPNTVAWLKGNMDPVFGYPKIMRFSWATCAKILEEKGAPVVWPDSDDEDENTVPAGYKITDMFAKKPEFKASAARKRLGISQMQEWVL